MFVIMMQFYSSTPAPDMHEMARALRGDGHRVWVATPDAAGDLQWETGEATGVPAVRGVRPLPAILSRIKPFAMLGERFTQLAYLFRVRRVLADARPDIVQVNPPAYALIFPLFGPRTSAYVLDVRQAGEVARDGLVGRIKNWRSVIGLRWNARWFYDWSCFATEAAAERILGPRWERHASVHRVGQDPSFLSWQWPSVATTPSTEPVRFVYVGTISRVRELELLLEAIRAVVHAGADLRVSFVGPDDEGGHYQRLSSSLGLDPIVQFHQPVPYARVAAFVARHDVALAYVPPRPDWNYQPTLKVLEYRALGMPIIASDNPPNREVVEDGRNGLLVEHDAVALRRAIARYATDRGFLAASTAAARMMRQGRTWADSARLYHEGVYVRIASRKRGQTPPAIARTGGRA